MNDNKDLMFVVDNFLGYPVEAKRHPTMGHWCGYITVPPEHPWRLSEGMEGYDLDITVHGGVTYYKHTSDGIVIGFDCGHFCDAMPRWMADSVYYNAHGGSYRSINYVLEELKSLCGQAAEAAK